MSATPNKRVNKTKEELVEQMVDNGIENFKAELAALEEKHGYRLEPKLYFSEMGVFPQIMVQKIVKKETPVETKEEPVV